MRAWQDTPWKGRERGYWSMRYAVLLYIASMPALMKEYDADEIERHIREAESKLSNG